MEGIEILSNIGRERVEQILSKALAGHPPDGLELRDLLTLESGPLREALFETARELRQRYFGRHIFLYGFVYLSTYCRNDCRFCNFRSSRSEIVRYRKNKREIVEAAITLARSGVNLIDLTMGEDPWFVEDPGFEELLGLVEEVGKETKLPIMVSPGRLTREQLSRLRRAGADWYACYQETHNRELFARWRSGQDFDVRIEAKKNALSEGLLVEEGVLVGAGAGVDDLADSVLAMARMGAMQVRAMGYVPSPGGLLADGSVSPLEQELLMIAVLRLVSPEVLIPASLDVEGLAGLMPRIMAGANVVTSLVPGGYGLAGVAQTDFDIENDNRSPEKVTYELASLGLDTEGLEFYRSWLDSHRSQSCL